MISFSGGSAMAVRVPRRQRRLCGAGEGKRGRRRAPASALGPAVGLGASLGARAIPLGFFHRALCIVFLDHGSARISRCARGPRREERARVERTRATRGEAGVEEEDAVAGRWRRGGGEVAERAAESPPAAVLVRMGRMRPIFGRNETGGQPAAQAGRQDDRM